MSDGQRSGLAIPEPIEDSIPDPLIEYLPATKPSYSVIENGTQKSSALLVDGLGFRYSVKNHLSWNTWQWNCTHRSGKNCAPCLARISQKVSFSSHNLEMVKLSRKVIYAVNAKIFFHIYLQLRKQIFKDNQDAIREKLNKLEDVTDEDFSFRPHKSASCTSPAMLHNHPPDYGTEVRATFVRDAKKLGRTRPFDSAGDIVEDILSTQSLNLPKSHLPIVKHVTRIINREREKEFPKINLSCQNYVIDLTAIPGNKNFELYLGYILHFLQFFFYFLLDGYLFNQRAVWAGPPNAMVRHDIFITNHQRQLLGSCKRWFCDGTFFIRPKGYAQVFSINGFLKAENGEITQVPLAFAFMKKRRSVDYIAIFEEIKGMLLSINIEEVVTDFERALFVAIRQCFPNVQHTGCSFHWKQAVLKTARKMGLIAAYRKKGPIRETIQRLLCLPYLPASKIQEVFNHLRNKSSPQLKKLFEYMERNWIKNASWTIKNWSVYKRAIRTNNHCEGLHNRWNKKSKGRKNIYWILACLVKEAKRIDMTATLLCHGLMKQEVKRNTKMIQGKLFELWKNYEKKHFNSLTLLVDSVSLLKSNFPNLDSLGPIEEKDVYDDINDDACIPNS